MIMAIRNTKHEILKALVEILEGDDLGTITTKTIAQKTDVTESAHINTIETNKKYSRLCLFT